MVRALLSSVLGPVAGESMPSTFGWIDHDAHARESITRILALFRERESRDELGLGGIRDAIADQLFPGTSTLHTRLRYALIVPWIYRELEARGVSAELVEREGRKRECSLIAPLLDHAEEGVLGRRAGNQLKRLPSSVYWAAMQSWGLMLYPGSQSDYHRNFSRLLAARTSARRRDEEDGEAPLGRTWHEQLPEAPAGFPGQLTLQLTRGEAAFLRDRVCERHPHSLLAWMMRNLEPVEVDAIWLHPQRGAFSAEHRELVHHGRVFAEVTRGAALLYNLELARLRKSDELVADYREALAHWVEELGQAVLREQVLDWPLARFWVLVCGKGRTISEATRGFVSAWTSLVREGTVEAVDSEPARRLVRAREMALKRGQSRFRSARALEQWSGAAGLGIASFRWPNAQRLLRDLADGLASGEGG